MCGINGALGRDASVVAAMNQATVHRGPDQTGVSEGEITIGMNRLAILDLTETGRQPMTSADGRYTLVFNGEIYNFRELRSELEGSGVKFRGNSDTEVLVEGYARWGSGVIARLRGMWAIAVRDNREKTLFLARDPFGIKPLYVYERAGYLAFSSEIKGLLANPRVPHEMDPDAVRDVVLLGYVLAPRTILRDVQALRPGEERLIDLTNGHSTAAVRRLEASNPESPSDQELLSLLEDSLRAHLVADVPVGLFFSGGMDSTLLAALLKHISHPLTAFHVAIEGRGDTVYARRIAKELGLVLREIPFSDADVPSLLAQLWQAMDQPLADTSLLPTLLVSRYAAREVKVVLSGEGGDELFGGYARHAHMAGLGADLRLMARSPQWMRWWQASVKAFPPLVRFLPQIQGSSRALSAWRDDALGSFLSETANGLGLVDQDMARRVMRERLAGREAPDGPLALDRLIYLPDDLLMKLDVMTMAASLEGRVPFLDREVFRRVGAVPLDWKRGEGSKAPVRRLLRNLLPPELVDRPKSGFSLPLASYLLKHESAAMWDSVAWYGECYAGISPPLDAVLAWARSSAARRAQGERVLGHVLFAIHTLRHFAERL